MFNFNGDDRVVQFAAGFHKSIAITTSGKVYVWGNNDNGQLGLQGDTGDEYRICTLVDGWLGDHVNNCYNGDIYHAKRSPTLLSDYNFATVFAAGDALFAIGRDGSVYSWGRGIRPVKAILLATSTTKLQQLWAPTWIVLPISSLTLMAMTKWTMTRYARWLIRRNGLAVVSIALFQHLARIVANWLWRVTIIRGRCSTKRR